ncbi:MAG: preprotein translocase subunit SecG [Rhizobiales bacterium]|nr:preprotein translocase subunit SecG [Hyphomicrobiales bacterium]
MQTVLLVIHLFVALALIGVILLQRSEGGALGIGGGNSSAGSIFSARGVGNALTRATAFLAIAFFATSIGLTVLATRGKTGGSAFETAPVTQQQNGDAPPAPAGGDSGALPNLGGQPQPPSVPTNN